MIIYGQSGRPRDAERVGKSLSYYRHINTGAGRLAYYVGGKYGNGAITNATFPVDNIFVTPFFAPPRGGRLELIAFRPNATAAGSGMVGIYENYGRGTVYPGDLLYQSSEHTLTAANKQDRIDILLNPNKIYWFAYCVSGSVTARASPVTSSMSLGYANSDLRNDIGGYALNRSYDGTLPNPFPTGAIPWTGLIPSIYVGFTD